MSPSAQDQAPAGQASARADAAAPAPPEAPSHARIVLDASGGDAPLRERVAGGLNAARLYRDVHVLLCGSRDEIEREMDELGGLLFHLFECDNAGFSQLLFVRSRPAAYDVPDAGKEVFEKVRAKDGFSRDDAVVLSDFSSFNTRSS